MMGIWRMAIALLCRRGEMSNKMGGKEARGAATEKSRSGAIVPLRARKVVQVGIASFLRRVKRLD